jgi:DNA-directed RNA polymerase sigma subunit (sigma70/sigma32)
LKAIDKYEYKRGCEFSTYATSTLKVYQIIYLKIIKKTNNPTEI